MNGDSHHPSTGQIRYAANGDRTYFLDGKEVSQKAYDNVCAINDSFRLAEILHDGKAPHGISDCTFMHGASSQFSGRQREGNYYRHVAESLGGQTTGKKYLSGLAAFPGDPEAWVDSRGDVQRVLEKRGWGSEGTINTKAREVEAAPKPDIAPDLLNKYTQQVAETLPDPDRIDMNDLREQVKERLRPAKHLRKRAKS
jgi:hypothetical protein